MSSYFEEKNVIVTGGAGFLGRVVCERLKQAGADMMYVPRSHRFDLTDQECVRLMFKEHKPNIIVHLAADVGGIGANQRNPGRFFYRNMMMGTNLIEASRRFGVEKFVQIGTVCAYPKNCKIPFRERDLWEGYPEETNAPYGVAKRALGVMLHAYRAEYDFPGIYLIPVNLYGPGDNFNLESSHVIPAMIRKFCDAADQGVRVVKCWGTGKASREFLYVDDAADAIVTATMRYNDPEPLNLGTGVEISIEDLAGKVARMCRFHGKIEWDTSRPDGQPRRCLDTSRAARSLHWRAKVDLDDGLLRTINWWRDNK
ncbi:MAG: GDP-L-fucose synthase family protein [Planctomycetota bacterium]|jgi:GDP-L-fucose synthase